MARIIRDLAHAGLLLCILFLSQPTRSKAADVPKPTPVAFMVVCDDPVVGKKLEDRIDALFKAQSGYIVRDKFPDAKLILFVARDVNNRSNPNGYTIAVAHVSNAVTAFVGYKLLIETPMQDEQIKDAIQTMIRENGFLEYLNAVHLDDGSDREMDIAVQSIVSTFFAKLSSGNGK